MNMNTVDMLLLLDTTTFQPEPIGDSFWIDNLENKIINNLGQYIVFNPG